MKKLKRNIKKFQSRISGRISSYERMDSDETFLTLLVEASETETHEKILSDLKSHSKKLRLDFSGEGIK